MHQQPIPCRLRGSSFQPGWLMQHDTELDPKVCYTDTHGYTEVVMATAALLGYNWLPVSKTLRTRLYTKWIANSATRI